jgi:tetratricopeptide (TPR) repeat protein
VDSDRLQLEQQLDDPEIRRRIIEILEDTEYEPEESGFWARAAPVLANLGALIVTALAFLIPSVQEQWDRFKARAVVDAYADIGRQLMDEQRFSEATSAFAKAQELSENPPIELEEQRLRAKTSTVLGDVTWRDANPTGLDEQNFVLLEHLESQRRASASTRADTLDHHGLFLVGQGRDHEAEKLFETAAALDPRASGAHVNLGNLFADEERAHDAEAEYRKALALEPDDADARYNLGLLLEEQDRVPEALSELSRTAKLVDDDREVLQALSRVLDRSGDRTAAATARDRAAHLDPAPPPPAAVVGDTGEQG